MDKVRLQFKYRVESREGLISFAIGMIASAALLIFFVIVGRGENSVSAKVFTQSAAFIFALTSVVIIVHAFRRETICSCPGCGTLIRIGLKSIVATGDNLVLCWGCRSYFEIKDNMLGLVSYDFIATKPIFRTRARPESIFPARCCVCGDAPSQVQLYQLERCVILPQAPFPARQALGEVKIPHCGAHWNGASVTGEYPDFFIRFRSYSYFRIFCHINGLTPE